MGAEGVLVPIARVSRSFSFTGCPLCKSMAAAKLIKQFLAGHQGSTGRYWVLDGVGSEETVPTPPPAVRLQVHPEALRLVAYGAFWAMVLFAIAMHSLFVRGVDMDESEGGAFGRKALSAAFGGAAGEEATRANPQPEWLS